MSAPHDALYCGDVIGAALVAPAGAHLSRRTRDRVQGGATLCDGGRDGIRYTWCEELVESGIPVAPKNSSFLHRQTRNKRPRRATRVEVSERGGAGLRASVYACDNVRKRVGNMKSRVERPHGNELIPRSSVHVHVPAAAGGQGADLRPWLRTSRTSPASAARPNAGRCSGDAR